MSDERPRPPAIPERLHRAASALLQGLSDVEGDGFPGVQPLSTACEALRAFLAVRLSIPLPESSPDFPTIVLAEAPTPLEAVHGEGSSRWNHSLCPRCWTDDHPLVPLLPERDGRGRPERCCRCGQAHLSGIYVRADPATMRCGA